VNNKIMTIDFLTQQLNKYKSSQVSVNNLLEFD
jgi:hypothetical protein